jgi:uncharacterized membrane protein YphA (DoxX/SURF4 family)
MPATMQERIFARSQLAWPVLVVVLAGFWIASGLVALWRWEAAVAVLAESDARHIAPLLVISGAILDVAIGAALLVRDWTRFAAGAAVMTSIAYLVCASAITPQLWADPLGPLVKIAPAIALALAVAALAEQR